MKIRFPSLPISLTGILAVALLLTAYPTGPTAPRWYVWLLRGQLGVVYFFAGVAKLNADWLFEVVGTGNSAAFDRVQDRVGYWDWYYPASNANGSPQFY